MSEKPIVTIFTDGACSGNPGVGGWAALLLYDNDGREQTLSGGRKQTTNNQMELTAVCEALEALQVPANVTLYTDSQYVQKGITEWLSGWLKRNWRNSKGDAVANQDLWQRLVSAKARHAVTFKWVRGHAGNVHNERVDRLAVAEIDRLKGKPVSDVPQTTPKAAPSGDIQVYTAVVASKVDPAAWGAVVVTPDGIHEYSGKVSSKSDYHAALVAALTALAKVDMPGSITVYTENETLLKGASQWIKKWRTNEWRKADGGEIMYRELWQRLDTHLNARNITWQMAHTQAASPHLRRAATLANEQYPKFG